MNDEVVTLISIYGGASMSVSRLWARCSLMQPYLSSFSFLRSPHICTMPDTLRSGRVAVYKISSSRAHLSNL